MFIRKKLFYLGIVVIIIAIFATLGVGANENIKVLKMVFVPAGDASVEIDRYKQIIDFVSKEISIPIEMICSMDYSTAIVSLKTNDCQIARLTPFSYLLATTQLNCEPIVRGVKKKTGKDAYYGYIIARTDRGIRTLDDLKNKTFAFVDPVSTSGYLLPNALFIMNGINPDEFFKRTIFAGSHPAVIQAVKFGKVDAGAIADNRYEDAIRSGLIKSGELIVVAKTGMVPTSPIVVRSDMNENLKRKIQAAWLAIPPDLCEKAVGGLTKYVKAVGKDYDFLREVAKILDLDLTK